MAKEEVQKEEFSKEELMMMFQLLNRVQVTGQESHGVSSLLRKISQMAQK